MKLAKKTTYFVPEVTEQIFTQYSIIASSCCALYRSLETYVFGAVKH